MPTKHPRIPVTNDPALADALASVEPYFQGRKTATVVHDLAIKGAEALAQEQAEQDSAIEWLIAASTGRRHLDWDALATVRERAWGE